MLTEKDLVTLRQCKEKDHQTTSEMLLHFSTDKHNDLKSFLI